MIQAGQLAYYNKPKGSYKPLRAAHNLKTVKERVPLLWGDELYVISIDGDYAKVSVRGHHLQIELEELRESPLLSVYQIDCGQGDSALVHSPDGRWMMVDGGPAPMKDWLLASSMVYGLINVRTDGTKVVMGVLKESEDSYQIEEFTP